MQFTLLHPPSFTIAGIAVRTTNTNGQAQQDIGALWQRFMSEGIAQQIPNRVNDDIYNVYTEYDGDFNAPYTAILGCAVTGTNGLPQGLVYKTIPAGTYRVYEPAGELPDAIIQTWMYIWQTEIPRAYTVDFDVYKANGSAATYLAVNEQA